MVPFTFFIFVFAEECDGRYDYGVLCMINDHDFANETLAGGKTTPGLAFNKVVAFWTYIDNLDNLKVRSPSASGLSSYQCLTMLLSCRGCCSTGVTFPWSYTRTQDTNMKITGDFRFHSTLFIERFLALFISALRVRSIWAQWAGLPQPLDMSIFEANTQTNEFGQWRGNTGNPTCMAAPAVCGSEKAAYNASTTIFCCPGLTCVCTDNGSADDLCRCSSWESFVTMRCYVWALTAMWITT